MFIMLEDGLAICQNKGIAQYTIGIEKILKILKINVLMPRKHFLETIKNNIIRRVLYNIWLNTIFIINLYLNKKITHVIFTATTVPFIRVRNIKYISVIHDMLPKVYPNLSTKIQNIHANYIYKVAVRFADKIITVSNFSKQEIMKYYNVSSDRIFVVNSSFSTNLNFNPNENNKIIENLHLTNCKYILSVATSHKHKNTQMLINAFESIADNIPDVKLVLVGQKGNCSLQVSHKNVIFAGFVSNEDLSILYKNAFLYCFPSIYEGFGTPCLDAQKFGIPLICSDITVFREVAGEGAIYCDPSISSFAATILHVMENSIICNDIINKGFINVKNFELDNIAVQFKKVLE